MSSHIHCISDYRICNLRGYSDQLGKIRCVSSAAEIMLRKYQNPIHLNGAVGGRGFGGSVKFADGKTSSANGPHLIVWGFDISAAECPQQKRTRVFGVNRPSGLCLRINDLVDFSWINLTASSHTYFTIIILFYYIYGTFICQRYDLINGNKITRVHLLISMITLF